jgi:hypothetical protein
LNETTETLVIFEHCCYAIKSTACTSFTSQEVKAKKNVTDANARRSNTGYMT